MNANQIDYDAKYPQVADTHTNDKAKIEIMERNVGKEVMFQVDDTQFYGKVSSVPNSEHYAVVVGSNWDWYIREEAVRFVINPLEKVNNVLF